MSPPHFSAHPPGRIVNSERKKGMSAPPTLGRWRPSSSLLTRWRGRVDHITRQFVGTTVAMLLLTLSLHSGGGGGPFSSVLHVSAGVVNTYSGSAIHLWAAATWDAGDPQDGQDLVMSDVAFGDNHIALDFVGGNGPLSGLL